MALYDFLFLGVKNRTFSFMNQYYPQEKFLIHRL